MEKNPYIIIMTIQDQQFDQERALYGSSGLTVKNCRFDGPADGESAFKESSGVTAVDNYYNLRYPFWHNKNLKVQGGQMTQNCRAALWYCDGVQINGLEMFGIKALRECKNVQINGSKIDSPEFGWSVDKIAMKDVFAQSEYFMMRSGRLDFKNVSLKGKYSFQYIKNSRFESCDFDTKDAFWHAKNIVVKDCKIKGEYLAWYCQNATFINCQISGTQPFCYCKNLRLINCSMDGADLAFEKSSVKAFVTSPLISVKNPKSGLIQAPAVGQIIRDDSKSRAKILIRP